MTPPVRVSFSSGVAHGEARMPSGADGEDAPALVVLHEGDFAQACTTPSLCISTAVS